MKVIMKVTMKYDEHTTDTVNNTEYDDSDDDICYNEIEYDSDVFKMPGLKYIIILITMEMISIMMKLQIHLIL